MCDGIRAAAKAGFAAVECHFPYDIPTAEVLSALNETGLPMLGLNTQPGNKEAGDFGLAAVPGREEQARGYIDEAVTYASAIGCANVHVMAGRTDGGDAAESAYRENLAYACAAAAGHGLGVLIEPINHRDVPGYHLASVEAARATLDAVGADNLKVMYDCYHLQIMQGDVCARLAASLDIVGHVQFAAPHDRGEPDAGELDYGYVFDAIDAMGYQGFLGAEYKPRSTTEAGLGWLTALSR